MGGQSAKYKLIQKLWPFDKARAFVHSLQFKSIAEWKEYIKSNEFPPNMPTKPDSSYRGKGFCGWRDFLGIEPIKYLSLEEFISYCRTVLVPKGVYNSAKFHEIQDSLPKNVHRTPFRAYGDQWPGWSVVFDRQGQSRTRQSGRKKGTMMNYKQAKFYTRKYLVPIGITGLVKWEQRIAEIPPSLPTRLYTHYKTEWISTEDFFGVPQFFNVRKEYMPFEEARKWVHDNLSHISTIREWMDRDSWGIVPPERIPVYPSHIYKDYGWVNWFDWFNKSRKDGKPIPKREPRPSGKIIGAKAKRRQEEALRRREKEEKETKIKEGKKKGIFSNKVYSDLYVNTYEMLVRFAYKYIKDEETRRDIVSAILTKIPEAAERVAFTSEEHLKRYCFKAVENRCIDYTRVKGQTVYTDDTIKFGHHKHVNAVEVEEHKNNLFAELQKGLKGIARMRRKVLELYFFEKKETGEIAQILDISSQTVLNHKTRGLDALRKNKVLAELITAEL